MITRRLAALLLALSAVPLTAAPGPGRYAPVNGLRMYYEIQGSGKPFVLLHGGGSTIESTYGRIIPVLARSHRVIAVELQAHGHTKDIDRPLSFEQDADDVAALLAQLHIERADFMGFSNGGTTSLQIAIRHPSLVNKLVLASAAYRRDGFQPGFFEGFQNTSLKDMPQPLQEAYLKANPDPKGLQAMFDRDVARMVAFKDISDAEIKAIKAPALIINGDADVVRAEHALQLSRTLPRAKLMILPGGHGDAIGEICAPDKRNTLPAVVTAVIEAFLTEGDSPPVPAKTGKPSCKLEENCDCPVPGITIRWKAAYCMLREETDDLENAAVQGCLARQDPQEVRTLPACEQNMKWKTMICRATHDAAKVRDCVDDESFIPRFVEAGPGG